jgi:hypothetical protein
MKIRVAALSVLTLFCAACPAPRSADADASSSGAVSSSATSTLPSSVAAALPSSSASSGAHVAVPSATPSSSHSITNRGLGTLRDVPERGGGCPCGCDHSAQLAAELRGLPRDAALTAIEDALRTIGEREDAGYITEQMVEHRLRLLGLGKELGRSGPARFTIASPIRARVSGTTSDLTKVRAELIVHGETTEIVREKEKLLRASFVLRLELENLGAAPVTLHAPTIEATSAPASALFPVSRWYIAGGDGQPWDGVLSSGEKKLVYVIGYAAEPLHPGTEVDATIHMDSLLLPSKVRARKRWSDTG